MASVRDPNPTPLRRVNVRKVVLSSVLGAFILFLISLVATGETWRATAYALVALFAFLFVLAAYFWGAMLLGGVFEAFRHRQRGEGWSLPAAGLQDIPEHDIDPGLELLAAGVLVYRMSEVRPQIHFRKVPLTNVRALRPFVVARTGSERPYQFSFSLTDEREAVRFGNEFSVDLTSNPRMVMPPYRLLISQPRRLVGQRWNLQVRSGVTVVTSFRFVFVNGDEPSGAGLPGQANAVADEAFLESQRDLLPRLLDEALKHDALVTTQEIPLEGA